MEDPSIQTKESAEQKIARLEEENEMLKAAHQELLGQLTESQFDLLTGLRMRGAFIQEISDFLKIGEDLSSPGTEHRRNKVKIPEVSLVVFDIDKFKNVNDTLGHNAGDEVLKAVAETIQDYTRKADISARWGGEEIVLAMIGADEEAAATKADFIREKISQLEFSNFPDLKVTVSAGVASSSEHNKFDDLFDAADKALYQSKNSGRNRVAAFSKI